MLAAEWRLPLHALPFSRILRPLVPSRLFLWVKLEVRLPCAPSRLGIVMTCLCNVFAASLLVTLQGKVMLLWAVL